MRFNLRKFLLKALINSWENRNYSSLMLGYLTVFLEEFLIAPKIKPKFNNVKLIWNKFIDSKFSTGTIIFTKY